MGLEPVEVHEHFDAEGNHTGTTISKRDPEWTDEDRAHELALTIYEDSLCSCGMPLHITSSQTDGEGHQRGWLVDHVVCYRCKAIRTMQGEFETSDAAVLKAGAKVYPDARKWSATEHIDR